MKQLSENSKMTEAEILRSNIPYVKRIFDFMREADENSDYTLLTPDNATTEEKKYLKLTETTYNKQLQKDNAFCRLITISHRYVLVVVKDSELFTAFVCFRKEENKKLTLIHVKQF